MSQDDLFEQKFKKGEKMNVPEDYKKAFHKFYDAHNDAMSEFMAFVERQCFYEGFQFALEMLKREEENNGK